MSGFKIQTPAMQTPAMPTPSIPTPHNPTTPFAVPSTPAPIDAPTPSRDQNPYAVAGITPTLQ